MLLWKIGGKVIYVSSFQLETHEMNGRPSYRQTRSLDNIGENSSSMDPWYRNTHLIFINENSVDDGPTSNNAIIER